MMRVKYIVNSVSLEIANSGEFEERDKISAKEESETQTALDETGFGKFNFKVIAVTGLIGMNIGICLVSVGFILPSASCDFNMSTVDKGRLNTSMIFGMLFGSCVWGCIADTSGRRIALLISLFLQGFFDCAASFVPNYWAFLVLKFSSGVPLSGQLAILYTYLGEFQPTKYREKVLAFMEIPTVMGLTLCPLLAWLIIPLDIELTYSTFTFKSWNLFVLMSALPSLLIGCMLLRLPETPKYLAMSGRYTDLRKVLTGMYHENTGNNREEYNFAKSDAAGITFFTDQANESNGRIESAYGTITIGTFLNFFRTLYVQTRMLLKRPYIGRTVITCLGTYFILSCLYTLMLWFPEIFQRFAAFEGKHADERTSVCIVSQSIAESLIGNETVWNSTVLMKQTESDDISMPSNCNSSIDTEVYIYTSMLGSAAFPLAVIFPFCVGRIGFRFSLGKTIKRHVYGPIGYNSTRLNSSSKLDCVTNIPEGCLVFLWPLGLFNAKCHIPVVLSAFISSAVTVALIFVTSSMENLILLCIYQALMSVCATSILCLIVELFPTNLRVTASALSSFFGRAGALIGNTMFSYLIDDNCIVLISILAAEIFLTGVMVLFLPKRSEGPSEKGPHHTNGTTRPNESCRT